MRIFKRKLGIDKNAAPPTKKIAPTDKVWWEYPTLPDMSMDDESPVDEGKEQEMVTQLERFLHAFGAPATVHDGYRGPLVTTYHLSLDNSVRLTKFERTLCDVSLRLGSDPIRFVGHVPGTSKVSIEVPNSERGTVQFSKLLNSEEWKNFDAEIPVIAGVNTRGDPVFFDLADSPHLLIGGTTGSGKSVFLNTLLCSILSKKNADEIGLAMIDPKQVELAPYEGIPHLGAPIATDAFAGNQIINQMVDYMEARYSQMKAAGCRSWNEYKGLYPDEPLPRIIVVVEELADLMYQNKEIEKPIATLAAKSRAAGIHLVLSTQRPTVNVVTGGIKNNFTNRIGFTMPAKIDSRVILDKNGAETLLGRGDMLFMRPSSLERLHGAYIAPEEIDAIAGPWISQAEKYRKMVEG